MRQTSIARRIPSGSARPILAAPGAVLKVTAAAGPMNAIDMTAAPRALMAPPLSRPEPSPDPGDSATCVDLADELIGTLPFGGGDGSGDPESGWVCGR